MTARIRYTRPRAALVSVITSLAFAAAGAIQSSDATVSASLPASPTYLQATDELDGLQVEPGKITYTGDGTGFLGGAIVHNQASDVHWTKWTTTLASGTGFNQLDDCDPDCARGKFTGYRVKIELWRPRVLVGNLVFTRMTIFYTKSQPRGSARHYTFTDTYAGNGYGWGPPDGQSYCVNTEGIAPAAGCSNIHSLPPGPRR
jgi:hypothetical protein